jgi:ubiquinol-cytochrome c reductase cytochrome b subunit
VLVLFIWTVILSFWFAGRKAAWSPDFAARPLSDAVIRDTTPVVLEGAKLFHAKGCQFCHAISGQGGERGPDLTNVGERMTADQIAARITNGGPNMPAYSRNLRPEDVQAIVRFLSTRR